MTRQLELLKPRTLLTTAGIPAHIRERDQAIDDIIAHHGQWFMRHAKEFVLGYLRDNETASGEDITDACRAAGISPHNDKAFGAVYVTLSRAGQIEKAGSCERRKGRGSGGILWRLKK